MIIVRAGLASRTGGLPAIGIESIGHNSYLEFAAMNGAAGRPPTFRPTRNRESGVELKSMTVDLAGINETGGTSINDAAIKHGTLGTVSSESAPRNLSRSSL